MTERKAYAKINLGLRILRRRSDGYHDIETVFHRIDLFDEITFEPSESISLATTDPTVPSDDHNLCVRAALALRYSTGVHWGASMRLTKRIPAGAGLGGGSSDAAATLLALRKLWNLDVPESELIRIALTLGSDVPYFLRAGTAYATGRGEALEYFTLELPYWVLVVFPGIPVSTAWAYQNMDVAGLSRRPPATSSLRHIVSECATDPARLAMHLGNDFEPLILKAYPAVAQLKQVLSGYGADLALLSGSGSSVFGLYRREADARAAGDRLAQSYSVFLTPPNFHVTR
jgi:4-diphosphocytidyl-2-C-methyl-D-erythritol kinase